MRKPIKYAGKFDQKYLSKKDWNDMGGKLGKKFDPNRTEVETAVDSFLDNGGSITEFKVEDTVGYEAPFFPASLAYEENNHE